MKGFKGKVLFGIPAVGILVSTGIYLLTQPSPIFILITFMFAFSGGISFWLAINLREARRRREENFRRKNQ